MKTLPRPEYLFVYGTLRKGAGADISTLLPGKVNHISAGTFQGRMWMIDHYPGVTDSPLPDDRVTGEIYALHDPERLLPLLDRYEGYDPDDSNSEYERVRRLIRLHEGSVLTTWIYLYNHPVAGRRRIVGGNFLPLGAP